MLRSQFAEIFVPDAVRAELARLTDPRAQELIADALKHRWIRVQSVHDQSVSQLLLDNLNLGEAETIALAIELRASLILMDEKIGRRAAERAGIRVVGVLGVLLRAKRDGELPLIKPEIEALRTQARFFISPRLEIEILTIASE